ncbi:MAG: ABC transporter ATP-binding protein [Rhodobacteraceae bacterium]|nr:ABC transporter ATP-binding protein [Paracoccaceae bacterium]
MLAVRDLVTHYGASQALFGMALDVADGAVTALLGRNGMGKTTTIHSVMGIVPATSGFVTFNGADIVGWPSHRIAGAGLGLVPEGRRIFPNLTLRENLLATASNRLNLPQPWTIGRVCALFPELAARHTAMGSLLSGGEQQMLAIGRALMTNPKLLILDEATEGLAPLVRTRIWVALAELKSRGLSLLIVDKNLDDLLHIADTCVVIEKGRPVWHGSPAALHKNHAVRHTCLGL